MPYFLFLSFTCLLLFSSSFCSLISLLPPLFFLYFIFFFVLFLLPLFLFLLPFSTHSLQSSSPSTPSSSLSFSSPSSSPYSFVVRLFFNSSLTSMDDPAFLRRDSHSTPVSSSP